MRKFLSVALVAVLTLSLTACNGKDTETETTKAPTQATTEAPTQATTEAPTETTQAPTESQAPSGNTGSFTTGSVAEILDAVWGSYADDDAFFGERAPLDVSDAAMLDSMVALPEANASMVDDVEILIHMMNANTFTCGGFHVTDSANVQAVADAIKANVDARQWMCGMPDRVVIFSLGDNYVFSAFGEESIMQTFKSYFTKGYGDAVILYDEAISF